MEKKDIIMKMDIGNGDDKQVNAIVKQKIDKLTTGFKDIDTMMEGGLKKTVPDISLLAKDKSVIKHNRGNVPNMMTMDDFAYMKDKTSPIQVLLETLIEHTYERVGEPDIFNFFTASEYKYLVADDTPDNIRVSLFNLRISEKLLMFSSDEQKHVLDLISELNFNDGLEIYSKIYIGKILPFMITHNLLRNK